MNLITSEVTMTVVLPVKTFDGSVDEVVEKLAFLRLFQKPLPSATYRYMLGDQDITPQVLDKEQAIRQDMAKIQPHEL